MKKIIGVACIDAGGFYARKEGGPLAWPHSESDLPWFKYITNGNIIVVGANSYAELQKLPPLKNREVWPVGKNHELKCVQNVLAKFSREHNDRNLFVGGGNRLWEEFVPLYDAFYLTVLKKQYLEENQGVKINLALPRNICVVSKPHYNVVLQTHKPD